MTGKTIVFCADGTWNGPGQDDNDGVQTNVTNVYKLFLALKGKDTPDTTTLADEQERVYDPGSGATQVAKYIHGVGDSRNIIIKLLGGAVGAGTIARIVRGYTYVSRNYQDQDRIVLAGFSRGAYTARALAGLIAAKGLLNPGTVDLSDKANAYQKGASAWYSYRQAVLSNGSLWDKLKDAMLDLPGFVTHAIDPGSFITNIPIRAVAVWDTVGAYGIPQYALDGTRDDVFQFASTTLSDQVKYGIHAVSIDEQRCDFTPTLWSERDAGNIFQALFPGAHADVGGGYPTANDESGLSDSALQWMQDRLAVPDIGVQFDARNYPFGPDAKGMAHQPWNELPWTALKSGHQPRTFPGVTGCASMGLHRSVVDRWQQSVPCSASGQCTVYAPSNIVDLFSGTSCSLPASKIYT